MLLRHILALLAVWSPSAAPVQLTPEQPLTPGIFVPVVQRNVQVASASGRLVAAWRYDHFLDVSFDGRVLPLARVESARTISTPAVAAGQQTFLIVWSESVGYLDGTVRARRIGVDGEILDGTPLELCRGSSFSPGLVFDGKVFIVTCTGRHAIGEDPSTRILRVTESGSVTDDVPPRMAREDVRPLLGNELLLFAGAGYGIHSSPIVYLYAVIRVYDVSDDEPYFDGMFIAPGSQWFAAAGPDRIIVAMFGEFIPGITLGQTTFDRAVLRDDYRPSQLASIPAEAGSIVWNGGEYVLVWSGAGSIRAIRLDRNGNPIDAVPFEITESGAMPDAPSLFVTESGVLIGYSRWESSRTMRAYTRVLERIPGGPRRRGAVRH